MKVLTINHKPEIILSSSKEPPHRSKKEDMGWRWWWVVGGVKKSSCVDLSQETVAARNVKGGEEISAD